MRESIKRLVVAQGPQNLLTAISVLRYEIQSGQNYMDTLVIGGTCVRGFRAEGMREAIKKVARAWNWASIVDLTPMEEQFEAVAAKDMHAATHLLSQAFGKYIPDIIYLTRNWQPINECVLSIFRRARKVTFGDGLGIIDSKVDATHIPFDAAVLFLPIEEHSHCLNTTPLTIVPRTFFLRTVDDFLKANSDFTSYLEEIKDSSQQSCILLTTSNMTEARYLQLDQEILSYITLAVTNSHPGDTVLIKQHPRETLDQSRIVANLLTKKYKRKATILGSGIFSVLPMECYCRGVYFQKVCSCISGCYTNLKYLYDYSCLHGLPLRSYQCMEENTRAILIKDYILQWLIAEKISQWDGCSRILLDWGKSEKQIESLIFSLKKITSHAGKSMAFQVIRFDIMKYILQLMVQDQWEFAHQFVSALDSVPFPIKDVGILKAFLWLMKGQYQQARTSLYEELKNFPDNAAARTLLAIPPLTLQ